MRQEGPLDLDRSPESWHKMRVCFGLWLKAFSFLALAAIFSVELKGLSNFGRGHHEEH